MRWGVRVNIIHMVNMDTKIKYRQVKLPPELHREIKTAAAKKGQTIIQFLQELIKKKSINS